MVKDLEENAIVKELIFTKTHNCRRHNLVELLKKPFKTADTMEQAAGKIIYVDLNAAGENDGSSWANAHNNLQDAIAESEPTDEIWVAAGTYRPTTGTDREVSFEVPDGVKIYGGFAGGETALSQRDIENNVTELTGEIATQGNNTDNSYTVVDVSGTSDTSRLDGFTITDGNNDESYNSSGGGIRSVEGFAVLANLTVKGNSAANGGGIYATDSGLRLGNVVFIDNFATNSGGGFYANDSSNTLNGVNFTDNNAAEDGGAAYFYSSTDVLNNTNFQGNRANSGGAININFSDLELTDSNFFNNTATDDGGAIFNNYASAPKITNVDFVANTAIDDGGAIHNDGGSPVVLEGVFKDNIANSAGGAIYSSEYSNINYTVANSLFTGNISSFGGAIYSADNNSTVTNSTFSENIGRTGGAIAFSGDEDNSPAITNSIVYNNRTFINDEQISTGDTSAVVNSSLVEGDFAGEDNIDGDPNFVDPANFDFRLNTNSPAIGAGNNDATTLFKDDTEIPNITLIEDIANNPRINGETVDLGAYEGAAKEPVPTEPTISSETSIVYVDLNAAGDNNGASWANAYTDLQDAIENAPFGSQIWVAEGAYTPTTGTDREVSFKLPNGVQIYGGFAGNETNINQRDITANATTLSGDIGITGNSSDNSVRVVDISNTSNSSVLDGFTISDGNADDSSLGNDGGGIYGDRSQAILSNLIVSNNNATDSGGGMFSSNSLNQLDNVTFKDNTANYGGGLYNASSGSILTDTAFANNSAIVSGGAVYNTDSNIFVNESRFGGNQADTNGGAIYNNYLSNIVVDRTSFNSNAAGDDGGAIYNSENSPVLTNVSFKENTAVSSGGAIFESSSEGKVANGVFDDNTAEFGGAIYNSSNNTQGINLTFANNNATESGSAVYSAGSSDNTPTYNNSIFWGNTGGEDSIINDGANTIVSHSIVQGGYEGLNIIDEDPGYIDREAGDLRILGSSAGVDAGTPEPVSEATDIAGNSRIIGSDVDLGAYEYYRRGIEINDVTVTADSETAEFTVSLVNYLGDSATSNETISFKYSTVADSAIAGDDFTGASGTVTIAPGETEATINVAVDPTAADIENNISFGVVLADATNAEIVDDLGVAIFGAGGNTSVEPDTDDTDQPAVGGPSTGVETSSVFGFDTDI